MKAMSILMPVALFVMNKFSFTSQKMEVEFSLMLLGPPWPKHPCTDKSLRNKVANVEAKELSPEEAYKWQKEGWEPFLCTKIEQNEGGTTRITGSMKSQKKVWTLYILGTCPGLGKYPLLIKPIAPDNGKYRIATFNLSKKKGIQEIYLDCKLPESYSKK
jgi:hypothetical protein